MTRISKYSRSLGVVFSAVIVVFVCSGLAFNDVDVEDPRNRSYELNIDPHKVVGYETCSKCHAGEIETWKKTPHYETFLTLLRNP